MEVKQYDIYWVNIDPSIGREMKKTRPCLIISPDEMNNSIGTVIIAPLSTKLRQYPSRVLCIINNKKGMIVLDQVKTIDKKRLQSKIGQLSNPVILQVKQIIYEMLVK